MKERLFTSGYCNILVANFLLYFGFYMLMPVLPFYLSDVFNADNATIGIVLCTYTIAALVIRPFSGYLIDMLARKPLYIIAYFVFAAIFGGYLLAGTLTLFIILRVIHGLAFGTVTVSGNTLVIDITPSSRRGEALGYFGVTNNTAMSIGPMVGLFLHNAYPFEVIFGCSLASGLVGVAMASLVKAPARIPIKREPVSLDRLILIKGIRTGIVLLMLSVPYGMTINYIAMYARQIGITAQTGFFFTLMAVGMAISRLFSGQLVDKGKIARVIMWGIYLVCIYSFALSACAYIIGWNALLSTWIFFGSALVMGIGFGTMIPAFNTLFVNLAPNNKRGTATSTYLTAWDTGIGLGMLLGGYIAQISTFSKTYLIAACLAILSAVCFRFNAGPHFEKNKLR